MTPRRRDALVFLLLIAVAALFAGLAPADRVLGTSVRVVYLHGAWVWAALLAFAAAALAGGIAFGLRRDGLHRGSVGLGRAGTIYWLTALLLSMAAMEFSWNGLFLAEPRWQLMLRFAIAAIVLQVAVMLIRRPRAGSGVNIGFFALLLIGLSATPLVMHPSSPVLASNSSAIQRAFAAIVVSATAAAFFLARLLRPND